MKLRQGRRVGRHLYIQEGPKPADSDPPVGMVDTPELARRIVETINGADTKLADMPSELAQERTLVRELRADLDNAERRNRRLTAVIDRIREHHRPGRTGENDGPWCNACNNPADLILNGPRLDTVRWPCPTIRTMEDQ